MTKKVSELCSVDSGPQNVNSLSGWGDSAKHILNYIISLLLVLHCKNPFTQSFRTLLLMWTPGVRGIVTVRSIVPGFFS